MRHWARLQAVELAVKEDGLEMIEWAIVGTLLLGTAAAVLQALGTQVGIEFGKILALLTSP